MTSGDFSRWLRYKRTDNFNGILYQQGRVLSDSDGTTQTRLVNDWQHIAGGDIIGRGVAAIPAVEPNSFKISSAILDANGKILVKVTPGRAWIDGMVVHLENGDPEITRVAEYLGPPFNDVLPEVTPGSKDAVILEVSQEATNAFQLPDQLIEPALNGPDTTEMLHTSFAFRLLRLSQDDSCSTIPNKLKDSDRGRLTVSLQKNPPVVGECPVDENYGYTGLTHNLYRIEVAEVNSGGPPKFKWSQFNGGLVGRGNYTDSTRSKIRITHNMQAILWSGLAEFYLEIIAYDEGAGYWKTSYGTAATLNSEKELDLSMSPIFGTPPPPDDSDGIFFRLWDGISDINEFTGNSSPVMLTDGICLEFDLPTPLNYRPLDYWTFEVRTGGFKNDEIILENSEPHGICYRRVPLSIIQWGSSAKAAVVIQDCRVIFSPLIVQNTGGCCSLSVGDGVSSHGDYDSLQDAIDSIGELGGEICLLEGLHRVNVNIKDKNNLVLRGCGNRTRVVNKEVASPIITITNSSKILIEGIEFEARKTVAIRLEGSEVSHVREIKLQNNTIRSIEYIESIRAIIEVIDSMDIEISDNNLFIKAGQGARTGIYIVGLNVLVARNVISFVGEITTTTDHADGGIQIGNWSENISITQNKIDGGSGNGITLGDPRKPQDVDQGFIYQVCITGNEISNTGLCGIGVPRLPQFDSSEIPDTDALGTGTFDMQICGNHISDCLNRPFDESMYKEISLSSYGLPCRGFGGILLTWCEGLIIKDNRIENNGIQHSNPICGIFIYLLSKGQIIQNYIFNNGSLGDVAENRLGPRGGILLPFTINDSLAPIESYSVRIHDNVIYQPIGRALLLGSWGTVSVLNNYFRSDRFDLLSQQFPALNKVIGGCVSIFIPGKSVEVPHRRSRIIAAYIYGIIFQGNQSVLGYENEAEVSHYILGSDDLFFGSNDVYCENDIYINSFLHANTLRACENRLREGEKSGTSLLSHGTVANITVNNQGDHCIITEPLPDVNGNPLPTVSTGNQVFNCFIVGLHNIFTRAAEVLRSYE